MRRNRPGCVQRRCIDLLPWPACPATALPHHLPPTQPSLPFPCLPCSAPGATNRPDALDAALRRAGRFDREIALGIPSEAARCTILQVLARRLRLAGAFDFKAVAKRTPGFVGADLQALMKEAAALAVKRVFAQLEAQQAQVAAQGEQQQEQKEQGAAGPAAPAGGAEAAAVPNGPAAPAAAAAAAAASGSQEQAQGGSRLGQGPLSAAELAGLAVTMADFEAAIPKVQPAVRREGFTTTPDVTWDDVGSLAEVGRARA